MELFGGAGHSKEIAKRISSKGMLIGIDRDEEALKAAQDNLKEFNNIKYIVNMLQDNEEYRNKFQEQLEKEINLKEECILDFQKCRYERDIVGIYEDIIKELKGNNE